MIDDFYQILSGGIWLQCTEDWIDGIGTFQLDDGSILMFHPKLSIIVLHYQDHVEKIILQFSLGKSMHQESLSIEFFMFPISVQIV